MLVDVHSPLDRLMAHNPANRTLERTYFRLLRVTRGRLEQRGLSQLNVRLRKPVLSELLKEKEPPRNVQLLVVSVPKQLDDLTPVEERR